MLSLIGQLSLLCALMFAILQWLIPAFGYYYRHPHALAFARPAAYAQCIFIILAYLLLTLAFIQNDFSILYVSANSHPTLPSLYQFTAIWGGHEGSILLWILILNAWTMALAFFYQQADKQFLILILATLGFISFCFLCFLIFTSNPFTITSQPQSGSDLNPLLQDPGFVFHPPMLYMGYVGFSVSFAIAFAALVKNEPIVIWVRLARRFATAAWCCLTLGILLGSWWAYRVLGWGGFWFWDPVENASLLPWLTGTALLHVLVLVEKRKQANHYAIILALICFALSLLGTFLVRSGILISVHSFANDPKRGAFLLLILTVIVFAAFITYCLRKPPTEKIQLTWFARGTSLLINSTVLITAMLTILLGTLYPLIFSTLNLGAISVGAPYFNTVMLPILFFFMIFMGLAPLCTWQGKPWQEMRKKIGINALASLLLTLIIELFLLHEVSFVTFVSLFLSLWVLISLFKPKQYFTPMFFAHSGFVVLILGILLASLLQIEKEVRIEPGQSVMIGNYQLFFIETKSIIANNYQGLRAHFEVLKNGRPIANLYPEKRIYNVRKLVMTKVAIHPGLFRDLYLALGEPLAQNAWSIRLYYKPFIRWIWLGGLLMVLGGLISMLQNRERKK